MYGGRVRVLTPESGPSPGHRGKTVHVPPHLAAPWPSRLLPHPNQNTHALLRSDRQGQSRAEDRNLERSRRRPHDEEEAAARERLRFPALVAAAAARGRCRRYSAAMRPPPSSASLAPPPRSSSHVRSLTSSPSPAILYVALFVPEFEWGKGWSRSAPLLRSAAIQRLAVRYLTCARQLCNLICFEK
jgi:hypothetical protein